MSRTARGAALFLAWLAVSGAAGATDPPETAAERFFLDRIQPLLVARCVSCHGSEGAEGGLRLDSRAATLAGGDHGPALVPGRPSESLLLLAVQGTHRRIEMPPQVRLPPRDIEALAHWIEEGAPWPSPRRASAPPTDVAEPIGPAWLDPRNPIATLFGGERLELWSLRPVAPPLPPASPAHPDWPRNDLDRFVHARLERDGIPPPPAADPRVLARRLCFDLVGLPPTPEQMADFLARAAAADLHEAADALVEALLASPRFGEHFARIWLDVVRYSDSNGFDWDEFRPQAWRYRDYVVRSFNADKPFDRFVREQLAGDELLTGPPETPADQDALVATGYLRLGPWDNAAKLFNEQDRARAELLADLTEATAAGFLGLSFACCRCHDHKHDPFSQADHYRLRAFFAGVRFADDLPLDLAAEQAVIAAHDRGCDEEAARLRRELEATPEADDAARRALAARIKAVGKSRRGFTHGLLMTDDRDAMPPTHVLHQGDHARPRAAVEPGFPSVLEPGPARIEPAANPRTGGRRLALADWIASPANPLTARVFVNRIWQALHGRPLVATPDDFGLAGARPEDPALLDHLADRFVRDGWSVKRLVRLVTASACYRQAAAPGDHFAVRRPRRLAAEQVRDAVLQVCGLLDGTCDGPPVWPVLPPEVLGSNPAFLDDNAERTKGWYPSPPERAHCRSLFLVQKRNTPIPLLAAFDLPDNAAPCGRRGVSTTPPQALALLNGPLTGDACRAFAARVAREAGADPLRRIERAFTLALQRLPAADEAEACRELLARRSLVELCRALLNLNEFVFVD